VPRRGNSETEGTQFNREPLVVLLGVVPTPKGRSNRLGLPVSVLSHEDENRPLGEERQVCRVLPLGLLLDLPELWALPVL